MPSPNATPTPITPPRVPLIDPRTGLIDRAWYMFFLSLLNAATLVDDGDLGPSAESLIASYDEALRTVNQELQTLPPAIDYTEDILKIRHEGNLQPSSEVGELQALIDEVRQALNTLPQPSLGTLSSVNIDWVPYLGFDTAPPWIGTTAGQFWFDSSTGSFNAKMGNNNITQQVGEELFIYGKASATISDSPLQIVYHTGTVGASSVITFAPTIAGITDINAIVGVATENIANNSFGRVTSFGVVRGITTNGTAYGEVWADDDVIWYNPVTGNPTKVEPVAPNIKIQVGIIINAGSGGSGSFQVLLRPGSKLGGTDSNVQFSALANGDIIQYDSALQYWKNVPLSTAGAVTSVTGTSPVVSSGGTTPAISLATGYGDTKNPYAAKTANYVLAGPTLGASAVPAFRALVAADIPALPYGTGTVTSVSVVSANGFAGTVATATTTPAITLTTTITGLLKGNGTAISAATANTDYMGVAAPVTKTADFTVANGDIWYINNKSGSTCTVTLPAASSWTGRSLTFKNMQAQTLVSASSNVVPIDSTTAGTAILLAVVGNWATMVSDGTNWVIMQQAANNCLLLE